MINANTMLLRYIAMADAYAMATEFVDRREHLDHFERVLKFERYIKHPTHQVYPGMYTDDTEMSCAIARVLISHPPPYEPIEFAQAWVDEFNRGGRRKGYARSFQEFLESVRDGEDFLARIRNDSDKNGACMRAVPIGVLPRIEDVLEVATLQAKITHDTPPAIFSARTVALMAHYALHEKVKNFDGLMGYLRRHLPKQDRRFLIVMNKRLGGADDIDKLPLSLRTICDVYFVIITGWTLMEMLRTVIELGGDTDSIAAISWGIASNLHRDDPIPVFMPRDLERGNSWSGSQYLRDLSFKLMQAYA